MKAILPNKLLKTAIDAACKAGHHALTQKSRNQETISISDHDVKLALDVECQNIAEKIILETYPSHTIIGEEGDKNESNGNYEWIIDPIDGTVNYTHGFSHWCCSIAVRFKKNIIVGVVYAPEYDSLFTATIDDRAKLNNHYIEPSETSDIKTAMVFTGLNQNTKNDPRIAFKTFEKLALNTQKVRITGSAALDMCYVAAGKTDAYVEFGVFLWDYAAAGFIAQQSGAILKIQPNDEIPPRNAILCSTHKIVGPLEAIWRSGIEK